MKQKKKPVNLGRHLGIIGKLTSPGFQKCPRFSHQNQFLICKLKKGALMTGLSIANPNFFEITFSVEYIFKQ
jgi:hypothetical protein